LFEKEMEGEEGEGVVEVVEVEVVVKLEVVETT